MAKLFETLEYDLENVNEILAKEWDIELGSLTSIKASQNHTFKANKNTGETVIVRVTPDPKQEYRERINLEVTLLTFLSTSYPHLQACRPIPTINNKHYLIDKDNIIAVYEYAKGSPVVWDQFIWLKDKNLIFAWGKWLGEFHAASRLFSVKNPEIAAKAIPWTKLHKGVMEGVEVHPDDEKVKNDPRHYGLLHGDVNVSNFFYDTNTQKLSVFDWDQIQSGWFLYDVSLPIFGVCMLHGAGSPDGTRVDFADEKVFTDQLVAGYESALEGEKVDRIALQRMVDLRRLFYYRFCARAVVELEGDTTRVGMHYFCKFITNWLEPEFKGTKNEVKV